jgi:hypothetical protein
MAFALRVSVVNQSSDQQASLMRVPDSKRRILLKRAARNTVGFDEKKLAADSVIGEIRSREGENSCLRLLITSKPG